MAMVWNGGRRVDAEGVEKELEAFIDLNGFLFERTAICYVGNHQATLNFPPLSYQIASSILCDNLYHLAYYSIKKANKNKG